MKRRYSIGYLVFGCGILLANANAQTDWPSFGNDPGSMRYSSLKQINAANVSQLKVAWTFDPEIESAPPPVAPLVNHADAGGAEQPSPPAAGARPARRVVRLNETMPLVVGGVLYTSTAYRQIVALD